MSYPGGKGGSWRQIVANMPLHRHYCEPFAGAAAVHFNKRPSEHHVLGDIDADQVARLAAMEHPPNTEVKVADALELLQFRSGPWTSADLVYCDPPYLMHTRTTQKGYYAHEFATEEQHERLLAYLLTMNCMVMISGYASDLYADMLSGWRVYDYSTSTRGGARTERLWMNYPHPWVLHDYSVLGAGYRERENLRKRQRRWAAQFDGMSEHERHAMLIELVGRVDARVSHQVVAMASPLRPVCEQTHLKAIAELERDDRHMAQGERVRTASDGGVS